MPVTPAVSYMPTEFAGYSVMPTEFAGYSVGRGISRGARKLARTPT